MNYFARFQSVLKFIFLRKLRKDAVNETANFLMFFWSQMCDFFLSCSTRKESLMKYRTVTNISSLPYIYFAQ